MENLEKMGTGKLFGPGTPIDETLNYIVADWVKTTDAKWILQIKPN